MVQCAFGSSCIIRHGLGAGLSNDGLSTKLAQEHAVDVVPDADEHVVAEMETVVTCVTVTVEGGIVGHVVGGTVVEELVVVVGSVVAMQEQALEILAADEEQGLAKAGKVEIGGFASQLEHIGEAWIALFWNALKQLSWLQTAFAEVMEEKSVAVRKRSLNAIVAGIQSLFGIFQFSFID